MCWKELTEAIDTSMCPDWLQPELEKLAAQNTPLYWYPGCGRDFSPVLFDRGAEPLKRIFPVGQDNALLLMSDAEEVCDIAEPGRKDANLESWHKSYAIKVRKSWSGSLNGLTISFMRVAVTVAEGAPREYVVIYMPHDTQRVCADFIDKFNLDVDVVAIIRQGGFSRQLPGFDTCTDLLPLLNSRGRAVPYCLHDGTIDIEPARAVGPDEDEWAHPAADDGVLRTHGYIPTTLTVPQWGAGGVRLWRKD